MSIEAMRQALEVLEQINQLSIGENAIALPGEIDAAMDNLRAAIEQAEKPVAWVNAERNTITWDKLYPDMTPLYSAPRQWVGLTDEERGITAAETWGSVLIAPQSYQAFARAIEAKLRERNT